MSVEGWWVGVVLLALAGSLLVVVSRIDLLDHRIPNRYTYPAIAGCVLASGFGLVFGLTSNVGAAAASATVFGGVLLTLHRARPEAMGLGDVKLAFPLGFLIGWLQGTVELGLLAVGWTLAGASSIGVLMATTAAARAGALPRGGQIVAFGPALSAAGATTVVATLALS